MRKLAREMPKTALTPNPYWLTVLALSMVMLFASAAHAFDETDEFLEVEDAYQLFIEKDPQAANEAESFSGILNWTIAPAHYLYRHQFALDAIALNASDEPGVLHEDISLTFLQGKQKYDEYYEKNLEVYYGATEQRFSLPTKGSYLIKVMSQGCADAGLCYPPRKQYYRLAADGNISPLDRSTWREANDLLDRGTSGNEASDATLDTSSNANDASMPSSETSHSLLGLILAAFAGGLILNLMPCVFPVLSLKALSFVSHGKQAKAHGLVYTAGVVLSFVVFALVIVVAKTSGTALGWGFQLQSPLFIAALLYLFLIMGLALSGVFEVGTSLMGVGQKLTQGSGLKTSFFTGVLAVLVASPCSAPFMATAIGAMLTESAPVVIMIFVAMGLGLALPILILSVNPKLAEKLPAPGAWMETFKQLMAFPLYLTCVWLLYVFGRQTNLFNAALLLAGGIFLVLSLWLLGKRFSTGTGRGIGRTVAGISLVTALFLVNESRITGLDQSDRYTNYTESALSRAIADKRPVFLYATADWCITCKVNERTVLKTESVDAALQDKGYERLVADYTNEDPDITAMLNRFGRNGVPLYVIIKPGEQPVILPQILSKTAFLNAL